MLKGLRKLLFWQILHQDKQEAEKEQILFRFLLGKRRILRYNKNKNMKDGGSAVLRRNRKPRKQMEGKDEKIIVGVGIAIIVVGTLLPVASIRLVGRLAIASAVAIAFALVYRLIRLRVK